MGESCLHVAELFFKIEAAVCLGYTKEAACTDALCKWNNDFVRKISHTKIKDIKFYENSTELKENPPAKRFMPATASQQKCLLGMLNQILDSSKPVGLSLFADYSESFHHKAQVSQTPKIPPSLREFHSPQLLEEQIENQLKSVHKVKLSSEQIKVIEYLTVFQSNLIVWKSLWSGPMTASNVNKVLHTDQNNPAKSLMKSYTQKVKT